MAARRGNKPCDERLHQVKVPSLSTRRLREGVIMLYTVVKGFTHMRGALLVTHSARLVPQQTVPSN